LLVHEMRPPTATPTPNPSPQREDALGEGSTPGAWQMQCKARASSRLWLR